MPHHTEVTAALAQVMSSLDDLATKCRQRGLDPMAMITTMMSGGAISARGSTPEIRTEATPSDAELTRRSRDLIEWLDRGETAAIEATLARTFVHFDGSGSPRDRDAVLAAMAHRTSKVPYIAQRTWDLESVVRKDNAIVFTGRACEIQGGNATHGGYIFNGWYLVQWVPAGDAWRVQLLTWQRETTERDVWNDMFYTGRGFSRDPNRLLVETVRSEKPGAALDLAMGQGRNALHLAAQGWKVTGVDGSDEALRIARKQATERDVELEMINANIDEWDFGEDCFDLVTLMYAGDHALWMDKIKTCLRTGGLLVVEGWAKQSADNPVGFRDGQLASLFADYEVLRDEIVDDAPDWAWDRGKLVRFVARKKSPSPSIS